MFLFKKIGYDLNEWTIKVYNNSTIKTSVEWKAVNKTYDSTTKSHQYSLVNAVSSLTVRRYTLLCKFQRP